jgi:hypothetical protein
MFDTSQNPLPINRIELNRSRSSGYTVINLYGGILERPLLVVPEMHFELLTRAGIDVNELDFGQFYHVQMLAHWEEAKATSASGTPYRNVIELETDSPQLRQEREFRAELLKALERNNHLLELIYRHLKYPELQEVTLLN